MKTAATMMTGSTHRREIVLHLIMSVGRNVSSSVSYRTAQIALVVSARNRKFMQVSGEKNPV